MAEHSLGKGEVGSSILPMGTIDSMVRQTMLISDFLIFGG